MLVLLTDGQEVSSNASLDEAIAAARDARVTVYPIAIESPSFKPGPLKRLAAETGGRYTGAAGTAALQAIYASLAQELRRTWQLTYFTTARPGDAFEARRRGSAGEGVGAGHSQTSAAARSRRLPGAASSRSARCSSPRSSAPASSSAPSSLFRAPVGTGLRRRLAPHIGEPERKRARGPVQERFATASTLMRATERAFGHLSVWHKLHRLLERADLPLRTVELVYACLGSALLLALIFAIAGAGSDLRAPRAGLGGA